MRAISRKKLSISDKHRLVIHQDEGPIADTKLSCWSSYVLGLTALCTADRDQWFETNFGTCNTDTACTLAGTA